MELRKTVAYLLAKEGQKFAAKRKWSPLGAGLAVRQIKGRLRRAKRARLKHSVEAKPDHENDRERLTRARRKGRHQQKTNARRNESVLDNGRVLFRGHSSNSFSTIMLLCELR